VLIEAERGEGMPIDAERGDLSRPAAPSSSVPVRSLVGRRRTFDFAFALTGSGAGGGEEATGTGLSLGFRGRLGGGRLGDTFGSRCENMGGGIC
jgi:hypothetical protein